ICPFVFDITAEMHGPIARRREVEQIFDRGRAELCLTALTLPLADKRRPPPIGDAIAKLDLGLPIAANVRSAQEAAANFKFTETSNHRGRIDLARGSRICGGYTREQRRTCRCQNEPRSNHSVPHFKWVQDLSGTELTCKCLAETLACDTLGNAREHAARPFRK